MLPSETWIHNVVKACASFWILMEAVYLIFALVTLLNMIQMLYLIWIFLKLIWFFRVLMKGL